MPHNFYIQLSNPVVSVDESSLTESESLSGAIQDFYPSVTEEAFLMWNHVAVALGYRYDISWLVDDIVLMLSKLAEEKKGRMEVGWPSNTFRTHWHLSWDAEQISVKASWECVSGHELILAALRDKPTVELTKQEFIGEWAGLLDKVLNDMKAAPLPPLVQREWDEADRVLQLCKPRGYLYGSGPAAGA